jgi:hypothetical protein
MVSRLPRGRALGWLLLQFPSKDRLTAWKAAAAARCQRLFLLYGECTYKFTPNRTSKPGLKNTFLLSGILLLKKALLAIALLSSCCPRAVSAPSPVVQPLVHSMQVWIDDHVRQRLAKDWDEVNPKQLERKYCISYTIDVTETGDSSFTVHGIVPAHIDTATPQSVLGHCPSDSALKRFPGMSDYHITDVHIHPPTTCDQFDENGKRYYDCQLGGTEARECYPSTNDWVWLLHSGYRFAFVQCAKEAIVPYFLHPYWWK